LYIRQRSDADFPSSAAFTSKEEQQKCEFVQLKITRSIQKVIGIPDKLNKEIAKVKFENCLLIMILILCMYISLQSGKVELNEI
jgi:hypothetical protein